MRKQISEEVFRYFHDNCDKSGGADVCWRWLGPKSGAYGRAYVNGQVIGPAHRLSYEIRNGPILDEALLVRHLCDRKLCVNPAHLQLGSHNDNMRDTVERGQSKIRARGQRHYKAKLTDAQVEEIRGSAKTGADLAREYGVVESCISGIRSGKHRRNGSRARA